MAAPWTTPSQESPHVRRRFRVPTPAHRHPGIALARVAGQEQLLPPGALALLVSLHRAVEPERQARLPRAARQAFFDRAAAGLPRRHPRSARRLDGRADPRRAAGSPRRDHRPDRPKMVINALNSGAKVFMADFEDSTSPTWRNLLDGQQRCAAVRGDRIHRARGQALRARPRDQAVLIVRPRGWHLDEKHVRSTASDGRRPVRRGGVRLPQRARCRRGPRPVLLPAQAAVAAKRPRCGNALSHIEACSACRTAQMKVTVLIETLPAVFEMDEILHALRDRIVGLNCGRWDYIFSYIKTFRRHADRVLPERGQVTMTQPFLKAYSELLIRPATAAVRMRWAAWPRRSRSTTMQPRQRQALARVRADKLREVTAGHDGTWVAHPALIPVARRSSTNTCPARTSTACCATTSRRRDELIAPAPGTITRAGFDGNVEVCVRYLAAWLDGNGCVPIHHLMEDAATAEISRARCGSGCTSGPAPGRRHRHRLRPAEATLALPARLGDPPRCPAARASTTPSPCSTR
jgi:malate synthase